MGNQAQGLCSQIIDYRDFHIKCEVSGLPEILLNANLQTVGFFFFFIFPFQLRK